ncbi:hypothetical protein GQ457_11G000690 [Hibiscus cannabinus]
MGEAKVAAGCFSVYVGNLSSKVKWRDLKQLFQRFGQVLDVFIPKKTDASGSNFGFVRFPSKREAEMAVFMFEGAWVVDRRIQVNLARFRCRSNYWRRKQLKDADCVATLQNYRTQGFDPESRRVEEDGCKEPVEAMSPTKARVVSEEAAGGDSRKSSFGCLKKITGHVDDEALRRLEKCVIGSTPTACSSENVEDRLHNWGLGDLKVKYLGGKDFLIEFPDEELYKLLEENNWAILKEVFTEVQSWTETFRLSERLTWIEIIGIPLHCWNQETFRRIANIWGSLEALGENTNQMLGCEKVLILISTDQVKKIDEIIELEAGRDVFLIRVSESSLMVRNVVKNQPPPLQELSSSDSSSKKVSRKSKASPASRKSLGVPDSFKTSSLDLSKNEKTNTLKEVGEDGLSGNSMAVSLEKDFCNNEAIPLVTSELEISGTGKVKEVVGEDRRVGLSALGKDCNSFCDPARVDVLSMGLHPQNPLDRGSEDEIRDKLSSAELTKRAEKDKDLISTKGVSEDPGAFNPNYVLESQELDVFCPLDREGSSRRNDKSKASFIVDGGSHLEGINFELPELQNVFKESRLKKKKFGSLNEILEKGLSEVDRRKRDRVKKRTKQKRISKETTELEGCSITESDMQARRNYLLVEAFKTLEVGKKVGIEFIGDENEVVKDLILLAEKEVVLEGDLVFKVLIKR